MKVNVTATRCIVENDVELNAGEYNINKFYFTFSPEYLDNYVKKVLFVAKDKPPIEMVIANDECNIPYDILKKPGVYMVGVYAYEIDENNELILRYSPEPTHFYVNRGSYIENAETPTEPDPDEFAQYYQAMQELVANAKPELIDYIEDNLPTIHVGETSTLTPGTPATVTNVGTERNPIFDFGIPQGLPGTTDYNELDNRPDLTVFALITESANKIALEMDPTEFKIKAKISDKNNRLISESNVIDLPLESVVVSGEYDTTNKKIILTLENGNVIEIPIEDLIDGLATKTELEEGLATKDANIIESISKNGVPLPVNANKNVNITVPTRTSEIINNSGFITNDTNGLSHYYNKTASDTRFSLVNETGSNFILSIDPTTFVMTATLKNKNGRALSIQTVDLPLESVVVGGRYDSETREVVLTLENGSDIRFSVADLVSGLQSEITANNKLKSDLVDDNNQVHKFVTSEEKTTWNSKVDSSVTRSSHSGDFSSVINNNGNMVMLRSSYTSDGNTKNSVLALGNSGFSIIVDDNTIIETDQNNKLLLKNVIDPVDDTDAVNKKYVDNAIEDNSIDVQVNNTSIVSNNVANFSVTGSYIATDSPLLSLWDVMIDDSIPLGPNEDSININTTSGNYDGTSVLLATSDTLESDYVPIAADAAMQGTNYSSSINNVGYQIEFGLTNNTSGDSNSIVLTPTETYIGNVKDPENDGDAVNKKYVDDIVISGSSTDVQINGTSIVSNNVANILTEGVYGTRNKLLTKGYADAHYVLEETIDDNVGFMYISPNIKDDKDVDFSINAQSNLDPDASADMNFGVEYDENEGKGHGYFRLGLYDAGSIEIDNNGTKITKVITPTNDGDAVNKLYVDSLVGDIGTILDNINGEVIGG